MRIFLTGVGCVGKTTIGKKLAELLDVNFFDLDDEIERFFNTSIERLQKKFLTILSFRNEYAIETVLETPKEEQKAFQERLKAIMDSASHIGWGYGDSLGDLYYRAFAGDEE
jgi:adenylate kinase family enzyme